MNGRSGGPGLELVDDPLAPCSILGTVEQAGLVKLAHESLNLAGLGGYARAEREGRSHVRCGPSAVEQASDQQAALRDQDLSGLGILTVEQADHLAIALGRHPDGIDTRSERGACRLRR